MKKLWGFIKDNFTVLLGICTAVLAVVYAIFKLLINVYYSGYFKTLNIDLGYLKIDYDGIVYQVIFAVTFLFGIIFLMIWIDDMWKEKSLEIKNEKKSFLGKILKKAKYMLLCIMMAAFSLLFLNFPLALVLCVGVHNADSMRAVLEATAYLYVVEIFFYAVIKLNEKENKFKEKSLESKLSFALLAILIFPAITLGCTHYWGSDLLNRKTNIQLVYEEQYAVTYNAGENLVLHKVNVEDEILIILRNEQKIIENKEIEYIVKDFEKIVIQD